MIISRRNEPPPSDFRIPPMGSRLSAPASGTFTNWGHNQSSSAYGARLSFSAELSGHYDHSAITRAITHLEKLGCLQQYPARAPIFHHGDPANFVFIVRQGRLKLSLLSRRGRCVVFKLAGPGDLLGISAVLNHTDHQFLAQTLDPGILVRIRRNEFLHLLQTVPEINAFAAQALAQDHDSMLRAIRRLGMSASVRERLAQLLLNCAESSQTNRLHLSIRMNWTYGELGDMVNSSRETVTRIMTQFEREGVILRRGSLVIIRNEMKLRLLAG